MNYLKSSVKIITKSCLILFFIISTPKYLEAQIQPFDSNSVKIDTAKFEMRKSAWGAVLRSAVLPGFGQFYNESYWKIPVVWGVLGYFGYQWNRNNDLYIQYRDAYALSIVNKQTDSYTYKAREFYKDQRDLVAVFIGLTYFLNLVDAYVDAHLFDFDISGSNQISNYQLSLKIKF